MANQAVQTVAQKPAKEAAARQEIRTPAQLAWRQLRRHRMALIGGGVLVVLYFLAIFAEFLAPYVEAGRLCEAQLAPPFVVL